MKRFFKSSIAVLAGISLMFASCSKSDSSGDSGNGGGTESWKTSKKALFLYYTGSECNPCGSLGIPNYTTLTGDLNVKEKVVGVCIHTNAPAADSIADLVAGTASTDLLGLIISGGSYSVPTFLVPPNPASSGTATDAVTKYTSFISTISSAAPDAAINVSVKNVDGIYNVVTRTKFLNAVSGTYKISAWVIEDGIVSSQIKNGARVRPYTHNDVMRGRWCSATFGDDLITGDVAKDKIVEKTLLGVVPFPGANPLKNWNKNNLRVLVIVWKHTPNGSGGTVVEVVNCEVTKVPAS